MDYPPSRGESGSPCNGLLGRDKIIDDALLSSQRKWVRERYRLRFDAQCSDLGDPSTPLGSGIVTHLLNGPSSTRALLDQCLS